MSEQGTEPTAPGKEMEAGHGAERRNGCCPRVGWVIFHCDVLTRGTGEELGEGRTELFGLLGEEVPGKDAWDTGGMQWMVGEASDVRRRDRAVSSLEVVKALGPRQSMAGCTLYLNQG